MDLLSHSVNYGDVGMLELSYKKDLCNEVQNLYL